MTFIETVKIVNEKANEYEIGNFYQIRKNIDAKQRIYRSGFLRISDRHSDNDWGYAFHNGGRKEMQFNIGNEVNDEVKHFRFGVAFSLETDRNFHDISSLLGKIKIFNQYLCNHRDDYSEYSIWIYRKNYDTILLNELSIPDEYQKEGYFVFFGKKCKVKNIDYEEVLSSFCQLLKIFIFIESAVAESNSIVLSSQRVNIEPFSQKKLSWTQASYAQQQILVYLRHNELQQHLYRKLCQINNPVNVIVEHVCANNCRVDILVKFGEMADFYEIKTDHSARLCIRAAIGQLLEYALWPNAPKARKLIVVGEKPLDQQSRLYLLTLNKNFPVEIFYEQVELEYNRP